MVNFEQPAPFVHVTPNFYHSLPLDDNSLTVIDVDYLEDSGVYTCVAHNNAGTSKASATITIHNPNDTDIQGNIMVARQKKC